jgi:hypothetical protein
MRVGTALQRTPTEDGFESRGEHYQIPRTVIRPRAFRHPERCFDGTEVSLDSVEVTATWDSAYW